MCGEVAVAHIGADPHPAAVGGFDLGQFQAADVDEQIGGGDTEFHVVDEVGAPGEERGAGMAAQGGDGVGGAGGDVIVERLHCCAARPIALTMFG